MARELKGQMRKEAKNLEREMTYRTNGSRWGYTPESTSITLQTDNIKNIHRKD